MAAAGGGFPEPVFVGGSARSGTHALGRLVAADPRYHLIGTEARFHSFKEGLPDLLAGEVVIDRFLELLRGHWWRRGYRDSQGLHRIADEAQRDGALERFKRDYAEDPWGASRVLVRAILDPAAQREGKPAWVEVTGWNVQSAPTLLRLFPDARFVNMVRDGRAVVAGHLRKKSLTDDPEEALLHWRRRIRAADAAMRRLPPGRALIVHLDDLVAGDREGTFRRVAEFLETADESPMRRYFDAEISAEAAHLGGWRERMPPPDARRIDRRYRKLVRELHRAGISWVPAPEDGGVGIGRLRLWRSPKTQTSEDVAGP
ncbi:MAG: sulfotransferase [Thermoleophilaceae bacterium]|nr:sulfotransferase [Thermoleophilaceae bacterium]